MYAHELPLASSALDRDALSRTREHLIADLQHDPQTTIVAVYDRELAVQRLSDGHGLRSFTLEEIPEQLRDPSAGLWIYVGKLASKPVIALVVPTTISAGLAGDFDTSDWRAGVQWLGLRELAESPHSDSTIADSASVAVPLVALANWHVTSQFCGRCGGPTVVEQAGWARRCTTCSVEHFPRTDSAVIMAILDSEERILLGNSVKWPENRFSTLAGFVESGESLEAAVRRESFEESGVRIGKVSYWGSQPWPFPASLMLGYFAVAESTAIAVDSHELRTARWFTRDELAELVSSSQVSLPGSASIARQLIETWRSGEETGL